MKTFLSDRDGLSAKDYLLIVSTTIFFLFVTVGLILVLLGKEIDGMYLSLLQMISPLVMTIVGSVAGVEITGRITTSINKKNENKIDEYEGRV